MGENNISAFSIKEVMDLYGLLRSKCIKNRCKFKSEIEISSKIKIKGF